MNIDQALLDQVVSVAKAAADEILVVYNRDEPIEHSTKSDESPLTEADLAANACIVKGLSAITPDIPILTEEVELPEFNQRQQWSHYWLVDPLDGTKEFIHRNGEFTVNIALIREGVPVLGVVCVPVTGVTYTGLSGHGASRIEGGESQPLSVRSIDSRRTQSLPIEIVSSRRHGGPGVEAIIQRIEEQQMGIVSNKSFGSSLKLCMVAAGEADLYPRLGPTSEWDTAAAQAVVEAAGGTVVDEQLSPLMYNQKDSILNPFFYVIGDDVDTWRGVLLPNAG